MLMYAALTTHCHSGPSSLGSDFILSLVYFSLFSLSKRGYILLLRQILTMHRSSSWISAILPSLLVVSQVSTACLAQDSTGDSVEASVPSSTISDQPSSTSSAPAQTHTIQVGLADHKFRPEATTANVGDVSWICTTIISSFSNTQCT